MLPLNVEPEAAPAPELFSVRGFVVVPPPPPPAPQAEPVVVRIPPAPACTQFPEVKAESVTFDTVIAGEPVSPPAVPVVFWLNVGKAVMFAALIVGAVWKVGTPAPPVAGPAKTEFWASLARVPVSVPEVVTGVPETVKIEGKERPTEVTVPPAESSAHVWFAGCQAYPARVQFACVPMMVERLVAVVELEATSERLFAFRRAVFVTKASVASFVVVSPVVCVVAVTPFGKAGVPDRFAAVPVVFWLNVGKPVRVAAEKTGVAVHVGAATEPVELLNTVFAACVAAPVPPLAMATTPVTFAAVPVVF